MLETTTFRKSKIELTEYDYEKDIQNRVLMARFSVKDVEVLQEILYSSLRIPLTLLEQNLTLSRKELTTILENLSDTKLFSILADHVVVDKEMRKYYEFQILKFEEDFKAGMDYFQSLLKKVPIHVLPSWYSIPRTSNNIFDSIVEKYLFTPQTFQRYLMELNLTDPIQKGIMNAVYQSPNFEVDAADMVNKFNLTQPQFEEQMILLEFRLVCCVKYKRENGYFKEVISPFHEWREYLCHVRDTEPATIIDEEIVDREKTSDFAFIEEMSAILECAQNGSTKKDKATLALIKKKCPEFLEEDYEYLVKKLCRLNLAEIKKENLFPTTDGLDWLKMTLTGRALYLHRHPLNTLQHKDVPEELCHERILHEAEKCVARAIDAGWVFLEDFLQGIFIPLNESHLITLRRSGRCWKYQLPEYTENELNFFKVLIKLWLYEIGVVALGTKDKKICFRVTPLGHSFYGNE